MYIKPMFDFAEFIVYFSIGILLIALFLTAIIFAIKWLRTTKLAFFIFGVILRFFKNIKRIFMPNCSECKNGKLFKTEELFFNDMVKMKCWKCDKCGQLYQY